MQGNKIWDYPPLQAIKHNLGGYSHRERCRAPDRITTKYQSTKGSTQFIYKIILETFPICVRRKYLGCCTHSAKVRPAELSSWAKDRSSNVNPYTFRVNRHDEKSRRTRWVKFKVILQIDSVRPPRPSRVWPVCSRFEYGDSSLIESE